MSENNRDLSEKDKPFILALIASGITIINIAFAFVGSYLNNELMVTTSVDTLKYTFTLTMASWTYYFGKKAS